MDGRPIPHETELRAELAGSYDAGEAASIRAELEALRGEVERICREVVARGQAAGQRTKVPAPPDSPIIPGGIRDRAVALVAKWGRE